MSAPMVTGPDGNDRPARLGLTARARPAGIRYVVAPLYEPRGEGNGWEDAPHEKLATYWSIDAWDGEDCGVDGAESRADAQAKCDVLNASALRGGMVT